MIAEFATLVGLLSSFSSGRQADKSLELSEFLQWLSDHNHTEIRKMIEQNQSTAISIKAVLNEGIEELATTLNSISAQIALLARHTRGFDQLASSYIVNSLSVQALEILKLMDQNQTQFFLLSRELGFSKTLILSPGPNFTCPEPQFFEDDVNTMLDLGLLIQDHNGRGEPLFRFTRAASRFVATLK